MSVNDEILVETNKTRALLETKFSKFGFSETELSITITMLLNMTGI